MVKKSRTGTKPDPTRHRKWNGQGNLFQEFSGNSIKGNNRGRTDDGQPVSDTAPNIVRPQLSDETLTTLLAKALVAVSDVFQKTGAIPFPFPPSMSLLFHYLAVENLWKKRGFPTTFQALWLWAHRPFGELGLAIPSYVSPDEPLLVDGFPTALCHELVMDEPDPEAEESARLVREVQECCQADREKGQAAYVAFRRLLIEHPVLTEAERDSHYLKQPNLSLLDTYVRDAYWSPPYSAARDGVFELCPHCGNLRLPTPGGRWVCSEPVCRRHHPGKQSPTRFLPAKGNVLWLRPGLRRYVAMPGQAEVRLEKRFTAMGIATELWPAMDTYDLRLCFPDQEIWGIDVKDWRHPVRLARELNRKGGPPSRPAWNRWFWVFPDHRCAWHVTYLSDFCREYQHRAPDIRVASESEVVELARQKLSAAKIENAKTEDRQSPPLIR